MKQTDNDKAKTRSGSIEKIIAAKFGDPGLCVYKLVDGTTTTNEIMHKTGLAEQKIIEILGYMDEQGIITLNYSSGSS